MSRPVCRHGPSLAPALRASSSGPGRWRCSGCGRLFAWGPSSGWYGILECPGCLTSVVVEVRCGACPAGPAPSGPRERARVSGLKSPPPEHCGSAPSAAVVLARLVALVGSRVYRWRHEDDLQAGLELVLKEWPVPVLREAQLPGVSGRIDFLVEGIGIEVKVDGGLSPVTRQLHRYLEVDGLEGLLLVTTVAGHLAVPREMLGKPVAVVRLTGGLS